MAAICLIVLALEIGIHPNIRHGSQKSSQVAPRWARKCSGQDGPQFRFLAAAMPPGPVLEPLDQGVIDAAPQPVRHGTLHSYITMLSVWLGGAAAVAIFHAPYGCFRACSRVL